MSTFASLLGEAKEGSAAESKPTANSPKGGVIAGVLAYLEKLESGKSSILEDIRLAEEAGMVFPVAEAEVASEDEEGDGLEKLTVRELLERGRVLGVVPVGTDRDKRRFGPWVEALRVARATAQPREHNTQQQWWQQRQQQHGQQQHVHKRLPKQQTRPTV
jgi:hypothetical protein